MLDSNRRQAAPRFPELWSSRALQLSASGQLLQGPLQEQLCSPPLSSSPLISSHFLASSPLLSSSSPSSPLPSSSLLLFSPPHPPLLSSSPSVICRSRLDPAGFQEPSSSPVVNFQALMTSYKKLFYFFPPCDVEGNLSCTIVTQRAALHNISDSTYLKGYPFSFKMRSPGGCRHAQRGLDVLETCVFIAKTSFPVCQWGCQGGRAQDPTACACTLQK